MQHGESREWAHTTDFDPVIDIDGLSEGTRQLFGIPSAMNLEAATLALETASEPTWAMVQRVVEAGHMLAEREHMLPRGERIRAAIKQLEGRQGAE